MYARNVRIKLRANSAPEFSRLLANEIIPLLHKQKGFQDEIALVAPQRNEAIAISFWDNQDDAEAYNHVAYLDVLRVLSKVVASVPIVESFEAANSTSHEIAASAVQPDRFTGPERGSILSGSH
jgi:heme-degrading monooxygenase HmoA